MDDKKKKRTVYTVRIGTSFYVRQTFSNEDVDWDEDDLTTDPSQAGFWDLSHIQGAARVADRLGGTVVKLKTRLKRVVTSVLAD